MWPQGRCGNRLRRPDRVLGSRSCVLQMMLLNILRDIFKSPVVFIIGHLKQSTGMSVNELSKAMKMSYMGVKQHCVDLEKKGYLDTWRRPKATGRPEKLYRLTRKCDPLFPQAGNELSLDLLVTAERVFGETAAAKLLFSYFQTRTDRLQQRIKGKSIVDRAEEVARLRTAEGCLCACQYDAAQGLRLVEYHVPMGEVARRYPMVGDLERDMISRLLLCEVDRSVEEVSGLTRVVYKIRTIVD